jgi:hypothetical protein
MKKIFLSAVALMCGTMLFAQYGPQYQGPTETATLQPKLSGAATDANTGLSIQNGDNNKVHVRQAGTYQSVYTYQDNGSSGIGGNLARVRQTGAVNATSGIQNAADVIQSGTENQSTTRQEGDLNSAITKQGQNLDSEGNRGLIRQGIANQAEENIAKLEQDGNFNQGTIYQTDDSNDAWTIQNGDNNTSFTSQRAAPNNTGGHYAYTEQNGNDNQNGIDQSGSQGQGNWAWAFQTGDANKSLQTQVNTDATNSGYINYAMVSQGSFGNGLLTSDGLNDLNAVDGDVAAEVANLNAFTSNSVAFQNQEGGDLDAEAHQYGDSNHSEQIQSGYGNDAFVIQNTTGADSGNYARQDQSGTQSFATLGQFGSGNKAWQRQAGDDNIVVSSQIGDNNLLNTYQDGDGNRGHTTQHGGDNAALLVQRGGHSYSIEQYGAGNQADVLQLGPNGNFNTDAIDCEFMSPRDWNPINGVDEFQLDPIFVGCGTN